MSKHRITYKGSDIVQIDGVGKFIDGTSAYVDEAQARFVKTIPGFVVEGFVNTEAPEPRKRGKHAVAEAEVPEPPSEPLDLVKL